ncbi:MAG: discoidin domain-containing protein [Muribaculaceae bacterium]|nr:discoidin domain-containing protein [Muribaculaceae bacterium]
MVSTAHLDTQWNWDIQSTIKEYVWNTLHQNLYLLEKYPQYIFNFEGGVKYLWMKEYYPHEYELLKKYVKNGRWHLTGASWDATDAIVPSVESAIRNILQAQTFYRSEFGEESTDIFLPDCFGFGWTLPTIAAHCGLIGFSSQKLQWRVNPFYGDKKYPFTVGLWQGVDGSRIMMAHAYDYTTRWDDTDLTHNTLVAQRVKASPLNIGMHYYGTGDIGGSPTIGSVQSVIDATMAEGPTKILSVCSDSLYKHFLPYDQHPELPVFDGELTMDVHGTGCYTSQAAMKLYNRQNEALGDAAERAAVVAELLGVENYPSSAITEAWRRFLFHQFHDDLTGTSIPRAYEFSWNDELLSLKQFADIIEHSVSVVSDIMDTRVKGIPVVLYNPTGHTVTDVVNIAIPAHELPADVIVKGPNNESLLAQVTGYESGKAHILVEATVNANGFAVIDVVMKGSGKPSKVPPANKLSNSKYDLKFNDAGEIVSLVSKETGREFVQSGKSIRPVIFEENESFAWPAWEILKKTTDSTPVSITDGCEIFLTENGPLRSTVKISKKYGDSEFIQYVRLYEGALAERIDFYNEIDWATSNALLKAEIPVTASNPDATYDLGLGTIKRGNNTLTAYEVYAQRWADLSDENESFGMTVMSDSKYGWDKPDNNTLRLTLLHTPKTSDRYVYQNHQDYGHHTFTYSLVPHETQLNPSKASADAGKLDRGLKAFVTDSHPGRLGRTFSLTTLDNPDMAIMALKKAEASHYYVVRLYETGGVKNNRGDITFPFEIAEAWKADGTEKTLEPAPYSGNTLHAEVARNGMATYKLKFVAPPVKKSSQHHFLPLSYDKKCFSLNGFESDADFSEGFSYAVELLPDTLVKDGIPFRIESQKLYGGKKCLSDTLSIPAADFKTLYLLAAFAGEEGATSGNLIIGNNSYTLSVPSYTGFIGQWGHSGHTEGFLRPNEVAYAGTHRHSAAGDSPYEFTYMFKYDFIIPYDAEYIVLPQNPDMVIFAATLSSESADKTKAASPLFRTSNLADNVPQGTQKSSALQNSLVNADNMTRWSGYVNEREHPRFLHDGNERTKWCDVSSGPAFVEYDFGESKKVQSWEMLCAGHENPGFVTSTCLLQIRNNSEEEWQTIDKLLSNHKNRIKRTLNDSIVARYVRLLIIQPEQSADGPATRIYEFAVY